MSKFDSHIFFIRAAFMKMAQHFIDKNNKKKDIVNLTCKRLSKNNWEVTDDAIDSVSGVGESASKAIDDYVKKIEEHRKGVSVIPLTLRLVRPSGIIEMNIKRGQGGIEY